MINFNVLLLCFLFICVSITNGVACNWGEIKFRSYLCSWFCFRSSLLTGNFWKLDFSGFNRLFSHMLLNIGVFFSFVCYLISFQGCLFLFMFTLLKWTCPFCLLFLSPRCIVHFLKSKSHFSGYETLLIPVWSICVISLFQILPRSV